MWYPNIPKWTKVVVAWSERSCHCTTKFMSLSFTFLLSIRSTYPVTSNTPHLGCSKGPLHLSLSVHFLLSWPLPPYQNGTTNSCSITWSLLMSPLPSLSASLGEILLGSCPRHFCGLLFLFLPLFLAQIISPVSWFKAKSLMYRKLWEKEPCPMWSPVQVPELDAQLHPCTTRGRLSQLNQNLRVEWRRREAGISSFKSCTSLWSPKRKGEGRGIN